MSEGKREEEWGEEKLFSLVSVGEVSVETRGKQKPLSALGKSLPV